MSLLVRRRRPPAINVIPLIDVMVVLIIFLLLTTHFDDPNAMEITPPVAESASKSDGDAGPRIVLAVDKLGVFYLNAQPVEREKLDAAITALAKGDKDASVLVVADELAPTKDTVHALDHARKSGLPTRLVTRGK